MSREPLLFLCHRIPYPPNKGDKIRSFNILKQLSGYYDIHLAAFVDDPHDWQYQQALAPYCKSVLLKPINPLLGRVKGLLGMFLGKPVSLPYFSNSSMQTWVNQQISGQQIRKVLVYSSAMAQYVENRPELHRIADFVDVDSDKWRQYADKAVNPLMKWVYGREHRTLSAYEQRITREFDGVTFVSDDEAAFFSESLPLESRDKVSAFPNGVDVDFFDPTLSSQAPFDFPYLVFTGAMDYWANVDAVVWFVEYVWPSILTKHPDLHFAVVGGNPTDKVKALAKHPQVVVTGRVEDIRPYIQHAEFAVAPLRIARGIQNKVLEAMALGKAVVMTSMAAEGIRLPVAQGQLVGDEASAFSEHCLQMLGNEQCQVIGHDNQAWIKAQYQWDAVVEQLHKMLACQNGM